MDTKSIRRTEEELKQLKKEQRQSKFKLKNQENFIGSEELLEYMQNAERAYIEGKPIITDAEWDDLVKKTKYEESLSSYEGVLSPNGRKWYRLKAPLVSLNKVTSIEDLYFFLNKFPEGQKFIVSPKFDGLTFVLVYKETESGDYKLFKITSRGDGLNGLEIHPTALEGVELYGCPQIISRETALMLEKNGCVIDNTIEIRGEAVIDRNDYSKVGPDGGYTDIVASSIAAGIFNREIPNNLTYISSLFPKNLKWEEMNNEQKKLLAKYGIVHYKGKLKEDSSPYDECDIEDHIFMVKFRDSDKRIEFSSGDYLGKTRIRETLHFLSFSIASKDGNIDNPDILNNIEHLIYGNSLQDFWDISCITSDIKRIIHSVDLLYGTVRGERNLNKVRLKNKLRFATDGIVIKPVGSNTTTQGLTPYRKGKSGDLVIPKYPKDQIAIKLPTDKVKTKILKINYITTKLGNKTCTADIEPTLTERGTVVSRVNLHNPSWLALPENNWIEEGKECYLQMAMDIIPVLSPLDD